MAVAELDWAIPRRQWQELAVVVNLDQETVRPSLLMINYMPTSSVSSFGLGQVFCERDECFLSTMRTLKVPILRNRFRCGNDS